MDDLYIVMPAYNECENIENVVRDWHSVLSGKGGVNSRLVVADSGSNDGTHEILLKLQKELPHLEILENTDKQHGPKLIALYKYAVQNGADWIFQTDSDGQTDAGEFDGFWELRYQYDAVIGNRTIRGDGKGRAFVEKVVCILLKLYFDVDVPDANAPFRLMKADLVDKYIDRFQDDYNIPNIIFTMYFVHYGEKLEFREITFKPRKAGTNSVNFKKIFKIGWKALGDFKMFKRGMKKIN
jgi:glycosyltransferase involved in cell wall biosynthesis